MIGYVINLDKDTDRLERFKHQKAKLSVQFERIPAVYGKELSKKEIEKHTTRFCANFCTPAMIGCAASHLKSWETFLKTSHKRAIICEDDVVFADEVDTKLHDALEQVPTDFDLLFAGCLQCDSSEQKASLLSKMLQLMFPGLGNATSTFVGENVYVPRVALGLHCYVLSRKGASKLVSLFAQNINYHVDFQINQSFNSLGVYAIHPAIAHQPLASEVSNTVDAFPRLANTLVRNVDQGGHSGSYIMSVPFGQIGGSVVNMWLITLCLMATSLGLIRNTLLSVTILAALLQLVVLPDAVCKNMNGNWHFPLTMVLCFMFARRCFKCS